MTIKDVAEKSGVSVSTVSRVLNDHPDVSEKVRNRVMAVVNELHYVPNNSARDLIKSEAETIGVIIRGSDNTFFTPVIDKIEEEIEKTGYKMAVSRIKAGEDEVTAGACLERSKRLSGLVFLGGCFDYTPEQVAMLDVPFVCCTYTNSFGSLDPGKYSSVSIDDYEEARRAVDYLIKRGHRKIAILLEAVDDHSISQLRYKGYKKALEDAGIEPDEELAEETGYYDMGAAYEGMKRLIERRPDITAVFTIADSMAIAAIKALHDCGRKVPEDCSVIAIDGIQSSLYTIPTLTTYIQPAEEMGAAAVRALMDILEGKGGEIHRRFDTKLREGGTVKKIG